MLNRYNDVSYYYLKIADENGEIEEELSALDGSNLVGKFGFNDLALIEKQKNTSEIDKSSGEEAKNKVFNVFM